MKGGKLTAAQMRRIETALAKVPYARLIGLELDHVDSGVAKLFLEVREELKQNNGVVHGGAIASLIDTAAAFAVITKIPPRQRVTTVDLTISYLQPLMSGKATATARVIRAGRRLLVVSAEVVDQAGNAVATALSTYITL